LQGYNHGGSDAFVAKLNPIGSALIFSTYLGGGGYDSANGGVTVDRSGDAYVTGYTLSSNLRTKSPLQPTYGGAGDAFVAKIRIRIDTTTTLVSNLNPSTYGQPVTFMAMVTSSGPNKPTGSVAFRSSQNGSNVTLGTAPLNASSVASLTRSNLTAFYPYPITAVYLGDAFNLSSSSPLLTQVVKQATSRATITSSLNPSSKGQLVWFTATITSPTVTVTGPVTFTAGNTVLGTAQLSRGKAVFTTSALPIGSTRVQVTYSWNSNVAGSSASLVQTVH
jgi:hypothetical protein